MTVHLIGMGPGASAFWTESARRLLGQADGLIGAARLLEGLPEGTTAQRFAATKPEAIEAILQAHPAWEQVCVLLSGDTGLFSGAKRLRERLDGRYAVEVLPGISSAQLLAARLGRPWQDWQIVSAHGVDCAYSDRLAAGRPTLFLLGVDGVLQLCCDLIRAGRADARVTVGEHLSYPDERIRSGRADELAEIPFDSLSVALVEPAEQPVWPYRTGGIPDHCFIRGKIPMTKQLVRAAILAKLPLREEDTVWDIGAGTGSVSVELARAVPRGSVHAVERTEEGCALIRQNRARFGCGNLHVYAGHASAWVASLPTPDAVFVGGSGGELETILRTATGRNPRVRVALTAVTLETLAQAVPLLEACGLAAVEVDQLSVSHAEPRGTHRLLRAENPIFLISARGDTDGLY